MATKKGCEICGRNPGSLMDRCGVYDGVALGPLTKCETCGRLACPDCLHEADCCFHGHDEDDSLTPPPGWRIESVNAQGMVTYGRLVTAGGVTR